MRVAAVTSALLLWLAPAVEAQDLRWTLGSATAGLPGDSDVRNLNYELDEGTDLHLSAVDESSVALPRLRQGSTASLEGFDTSRYPVAAIEAFFDREPGPEDERSPFQSSATLRLVVRTRAADGSVRWWRPVG
jgi:hypothetical protein